MLFLECERHFWGSKESLLWNTTIIKCRAELFTHMWWRHEFFYADSEQKKMLIEFFLLTSFFAVRFVTKKDFFQLCLSISLKPITFIDLLLFFLWWYLRKKFSVGNIEIWGGNRIKRNCFIFKDRTLIYFNEHFQRKQNPWFITAMKDQTLSALDITFL